MLHAFYLLFFSLQNVQAEFQKVWILIMSHSHMRRITARASSLPSVCEIIASMEGKQARTKMFVKIIGRNDIGIVFPLGPFRMALRHALFL